MHTGTYMSNLLLARHRISTEGKESCQDLKIFFKKEILQLAYIQKQMKFDSKGLVS